MVDFIKRWKGGVLEQAYSLNHSVRLSSLQGAGESFCIEIQMLIQSSIESPFIARGKI